MDFTRVFPIRLDRFCWNFIQKLRRCSCSFLPNCVCPYCAFRSREQKNDFSVFLCVCLFWKHEKRPFPFIFLDMLLWDTDRKSTGRKSPEGLFWPEHVSFSFLLTSATYWTLKLLSLWELTLNCYIGWIAHQSRYCVIPFISLHNAYVKNNVGQKALKNRIKLVADSRVNLS